MSRVIHMRGDTADMFLLFLFFFLGVWQVLVAWYRLSGFSLTGYPDRRCWSMVIGAVLIAGSCSWYFSTPGHFASPDVEGIETMMLLVAGLVAATATHVALVLLVQFARRPPGKAVSSKTPGEELSITVGVASVPSWFAPARGAGAKATPVLLLHDYGGDRNDLRALEEALAQSGHAALAVELDGHGDNPRDIDSPVMSDLLEAAARALMQKAGSEAFVAVGVGLGGALAIELFRKGLADRAVAVDPPARDGDGFPAVNSLSELGPLEVARAFARPPARGAGGNRLSLARLLAGLPAPGALEPGRVIVVGTQEKWFNAPDALEDFVRASGLPGTLPVPSRHGTIARDAGTLEAVVRALA